jgi:membrane protease YdiL (CAAX protease family)
MNLGNYPIAPLIFALLIPLLYCLVNKKSEMKNMLVLFVSGIIMVALYPIIFYLPNSFGIAGYAFIKFIIFVCLPIVTILYLEKWDLMKILYNVGINKDNLSKSIIFGLIAAVIMIVVVLIISTTFQTDIYWYVITFIESFTEEFYFRGVLLLYLAQKVDIRIAFATSIIGFIVVHPQHFITTFLISTTIQAVLLAIVVYKTKNIIGAWIAHGLTRTCPNLIRIALGF